MNTPLPPTALTPEIQLLDGPYADTALAEFAKEQVIEFTPLPPTALTPELQILDGPAAETALAALPSHSAKEEQVIEFTPFPEGGYFKYAPRKDFPPQCIIVDAAGIQLCIARNVDVAEFLCNACNCFVLASLMNKVQDQKIVEPSSPLILPGGNSQPVFES